MIVDHFIMKYLFCSLYFFLFISFHLLSDIERIAPYLIPEDHYLKETLDKIFSSSRILYDENSLKEAGFINVDPRYRNKKSRKVYVSRNALLPGLIVKCYNDSQKKDKEDYEYWLLRIQGAELIRDFIHTHGWESVFKVPRKWIYILPNVSQETGKYPKKTILIEEDMEILDERKNRLAWKSEKVTQDLLEKIYLIVTELGLRGCAKGSNIPFSIDGKIAFIDTTPYNTYPVHYERLDSFLSPEMKKYWKQITTR